MTKSQFIPIFNLKNVLPLCHKNIYRRFHKNNKDRPRAYISLTEKEKYHMIPHNVGSKTQEKNEQKADL